MQLRICTWNIHMGLELTKLTKAIKGPADFGMIDIMTIQEASIHKGVKDAAVIAKSLGKHFAYEQVHAQIPKKRIVSWYKEIQGLPQEHSIIWNTKTVSISSCDTLILPPYDTSTKLTPHGRAILKLSTTQKRMCIVIDGKINGYTFRLYNIHFDVIGPVPKIKQFQAVIQDLKKRKKVDIAILAGDLNTFKYFKRPSWAKLLAYAETEGFMELTSDIHWTFSDRRFPYKHKVDAIFVRYKKPLVYNSWALDISGSDHLPVFANIELP